jgi:hypothetical protein
MFLDNFLIARKDFQFSLAENFEISLKKLSIQINKKIKISQIFSELKTLI